MNATTLELRKLRPEIIQRIEALDDQSLLLVHRVLLLVEKQRIGPVEGGLRLDAFGSVHEFLRLLIIALPRRKRPSHRSDGLRPPSESATLAAFYDS